MAKGGLTGSSSWGPIGSVRTARLSLGLWYYPQGKGEAGELPLECFLMEIGLVLRKGLDWRTGLQSEMTPESILPEPPGRVSPCCTGLSSLWRSPLSLPAVLHLYGPGAWACQQHKCSPSQWHSKSVAGRELAEHVLQGCVPV